MQKPTTTGFALPSDFPVEGYNRVHAYLNKYKGIHEVQWMSFGEGWNGLVYRYRAMAEYDEQFTTYMRKFGGSPPPEERYEQGKAFFGFFANAVSVIDCFFFSAYCLASIVKPDGFPISRSQDLRFSKEEVKRKFNENFPKDDLSKEMNACLSADSYTDINNFRIVLIHRGMPPRRFYQGGERHGMTTMPINPEAPSDQWQFDFSVDEQTTKVFREWLSNTLAGLMDSAYKFCTSTLKT